MSFVLTEEQQLFSDQARKVLQARAPVGVLRRQRDANDPLGFSRELWTELAGMGWAGVLIPEDYGGVGFGHVGAGLIAEEAGRTLASLPLLSTAVLGATALLEGGSERQKTELLPAIAGGELVTALAVDERSRHAPHDIETTAAQITRGGFRLNGRKTFVLDAQAAGKLIVSARVADAVALFVVDARAPGVSIEPTVMVDSRGAADVRLTNVDVAAGDLLGASAGGLAVLDRVLDAGRAVLAAELVGIASEALERTLEYLRQREQFGRKIGEFQSLQHRAAVLFVEIELARSAAAGALRALDARTDDAPLLVSVAKAKCGDAARLATNEALQMHGGIGMTDEFDIGFFMKRARVAGETFGDTSFHADRVARSYGF
jgi:alkylation response protein AidB-like acyl-CoA dehydrogenase